MQQAAFTPEEAARYTGQSRRQVYRLLSSGALKARKHGRKTLILHEDIKAWLASLPDAALESTPLAA